MAITHSASTGTSPQRAKGVRPEHWVPIPGKDCTNCRQRGDCSGALEWLKPGGDFKEARVFNGKVVERGWVIGPDGRSVETDY